MNNHTEGTISPRFRNIWIASGVLALVVGMLASPVVMAKGSSANGPQAKEEASLSKQVYERLITIPWYNVFDNLEYKIEGNTVTVSGQVVFPLTKSSVRDALEGVRGLERVVNNVQELSNTPLDNQLRWAVYRAIFYRNSPLFHYSLGPNPPIHIIVNNGRVTLVGVVISPMDREIAGMRARSVPGTISVTNNLRVEK